MAKRPSVMCRICRERFYREDGEENIDWVNPTNNYYYHKTCYDNWRDGKSNPNWNGDDNFWFESLKDYLRKDLKVEINWKKVISQWNNFLKKEDENGKRLTAKGIYFSIRYFYGVKGNPIDKTEGGIGIVPFIYEESCNYWFKRKEEIDRVVQEIKAQLEKANNQETIKIKSIAQPSAAQRQANKFTFDMIASEE